MVGQLKYPLDTTHQFGGIVTQYDQYTQFFGFSICTTEKDISCILLDDDNFHRDFFFQGTYSSILGSV